MRPDRLGGAGVPGPERPSGSSARGPEPDRSGLAAWVFIEHLDHPEAAPEDAHHLGRVLRLRPGQAVGASDGRGRWRRCAVASTPGEPLRLEATAAVVAEPAPSPPVTVGFALVKGDRPELVVQKLTELGVDRILPLAAARSVVRWDADRAVRGVLRLRQVAREAAMQSRRAHLPEVGDVTTLSAISSTLRGRGGLCQQAGADAPSLLRPALFVGPEGGWTETEVSCGFPLVSLGSTTLRAETAAITAAVFLCGLRSATVRERGCLAHPNELGPTT